MKKFLVVTAIILSVLLVFSGCKKGTDSAKSLKVGMVTDSGTIDDKSFNQGTWEGILAAVKDFGVSEKYLKPAGETEADYMTEIGNLYDAGYKFIVTPGFKFETAILAAQEKYKDANFILLDGLPNNGKYDDTRVELVGPNTVSIFFAEHESGFIAGLAAALELKTGEFGFIGGMEIPAVQKFNWGFQQGVLYANKNMGTNIVMKAENVIYQGTFNEVAAGQQLAASMFDKGLKAIFCAAGGVGVGAINEAKSRREGGENVWIIGVDVDQYPDGIYSGDKSVILTSAMKKIDTAAYDMIKAKLDGKLPGGKTLIFNARNDGVGIPAENPNLDDKIEKEVAKVVDQIKKGKIVVAAEQGSLIK